MAIFTLPIARVGDSNYRVGSGYKLYFYDAGTTDARDTYTSNTYATPLSNPVEADANGYFDVIWTSGDYKVRLTTDADVLVWEVDNYTNDSGVTTFAEGVLSSPSSAANVITASLTTAPAYPYVDQLQVVVELQHGANTTTNPTFNLNGLGAKTIKRTNNTALIAGDTGGSGAKIYLSYSTTNDVWILLNPVYAPLRTYAEYPMGLEWKSGLSYIQAADADHDITVSAGSIMDTNNVYRMTLASAFTKQIDATFAVGTTLGGRSDDDVLGNNTWYGIWLLSKSTNPSDCDVIFATTKAKSLSDAVATAAGFNISRLIGAVLTDGSANIVDFVDGGDGWQKWLAQRDESASDDTSGVAITISSPPFMQAKLVYEIGTSSSTATTSTKYGLIIQTNQTNYAPNVPSNSTVWTQIDASGLGNFTTLGITNTIVIDLKADSASQVFHRESTTNGLVYVKTLGWKFLPTVTDLV